MSGRSRGIAKLAIDKCAFRFFSLLRRRASAEPDFRGIVVPVDDLIGHHIISTGRFEATQFDGLYNLLQQSGTASRARAGRFVDIGANIGLYSLAFSDWFSSTVAIEANPQTYRILVANLALRDKASVTPLCVGASNASAEVEIHVPTNGNLGWATLSSTHHKLPTKAVPVSIRPLDHILRDCDGPPVTLLKIDVEGHEQQVLEGARRILEDDGPIVLFEVLNKYVGSNSAVLLQSCGYEFFYTFQRELPRGPNKFVRIWRGVRSGLPVSIKPVPPEDLHSSALICASKSPLT